MPQDEIKIVKFKQELPPQWFVLLIGPDIFSVTTWTPTSDFNTATSPSPIIMIIVLPSSGLSFYVDGSLKLMWVETDGWKKQVLVIQTIVPPEILLPDWNQGLVGLLIDYMIHHRGPASSFGVSWQTGTTPFSAQGCLICKLIVANQID